MKKVRYICRCVNILTKLSVNLKCSLTFIEVSDVFIAVMA